ncbi:unnamed protein product [Caenorhabditis brenneri]
MGNWSTKPKIKNREKSENLLSKLECVAIPPANFVSADKIDSNLEPLPHLPCNYLETEDEGIAKESPRICLKQPNLIIRPRSKSAPSLLLTQMPDASSGEFIKIAHKMELSKIRNTEKSRLQHIKDKSDIANKKFILRNQTITLRYRTKEEKLIKEFNDLCFLAHRNNMRRFQRECEYISKLFNEFKLAFSTLDLTLSMSSLQFFDGAVQLLVLPDDQNHSFEAQVDVLKRTNELRRLMNRMMCENYFKKTGRRRKQTNKTRKKKNNKKKKQKNKKKKKNKRKKNKSCSTIQNNQFVFIKSLDEYEVSKELLEELEGVLRKFFALLPMHINLKYTKTTRETA